MIIVFIVPAKLHAICVICVYLDKLYSQVHLQGMISMNKSGWLLSNLYPFATHVAGNLVMYDRYIQEMHGRYQKWLHP